MSATYRQDSRLRPDLREIDPGNRLLASQSPRRLEAEFVRDNALAIAGLLNPDIGGPSVFPYQPPGYYANLQFPDRDYIADTDDRQYRRGVYMHWQRTFLQPMLANFDAPPREDCTAARNVANTPQQALTLLNDPTFVEAARVLAQSLLATTGAIRRRPHRSALREGPGPPAPRQRSGNPCSRSWPPSGPTSAITSRGRPAPPRRPGPAADGPSPNPSWPPGPWSAGSCSISMKRSPGIEIMNNPYRSQRRGRPRSAAGPS